MTVKVLIKRRFKEKYFNEISAMLKELRYGALGQVGYISAETLWDAKDPFRVVVAATWRTMKDWNVWKNSEQRREVDTKINEYLDGETEYEIFELGAYPH